MTDAPDLPAVRVRDVTKSYGDVEVLRGVSLDIAHGETLCILGGSGGGKSTLFRIMIGALEPTSGRVWVDGEELTACQGSELDKLRRRFGVMFQSGALLNSMTVADNVALPLRYHSALDDEVEVVLHHEAAKRHRQAAHVNAGRAVRSSFT